MKKILSLILSIAILMLFCTSCSLFHTKLDAPDNLRIENGIVMWNSVEKAKSYTVKIDTAEYTTTSTCYSLSGIPVADQPMQISVRANSEGLFKESSDFCESVTFTPQSDNSDTVRVIKRNLSQTPRSRMSELRKATPNPITSPSYMFRDDDYCYYFFDLGTLSKVPINGFDSNTMFKFENHGATVTRRLESSETDVTGIESSVATTASETVDVSNTHGLKLKWEHESVKNKFSAEFAFSRTKTTSNTTSFTESYTKASSYSKTNKIAVDMTFDENAEDGYYGYILAGNLRIYVLLVRDISTDEYSIEYYSDILQCWTEFCYFPTADDFLNYKYDTIDFDIPENLPIPDTYNAPEKYDPITVQMTRYSCRQDNQYNKSEAASENDAQYRHEGFELGELVLYGCAGVGNSFKAGEANKLSVKYHVLLDAEDLPRNGSSLTKVENDTETRARGTNIDSQIGYGAYWIRITYADGMQIQRSKTNIFRYTTADSYIDLMEDMQVDPAKTITKIDVVIVYELYSGGPGFMGIWWKHHTNWRCEYTFNFVK